MPIGKHRGSFDGAYGAYYGGHWIKVNYQNKYDAARGRAPDTSMTSVSFLMMFRRARWWLFSEFWMTFSISGDIIHAV
jgi:hypothetical protein